MPRVRLRRIKLDVLKPHRPSVLDFAIGLGAYGGARIVEVSVVEMDEKTETLEVIVQGPDIVFETLVKKIRDLSGSVHSIDEVLVESDEPDPQAAP